MQFFEEDVGISAGRLFVTKRKKLQQGVYVLVMVVDHVVAGGMAQISPGVIFGLWIHNEFEGKPFHFRSYLCGS